jgi:hypothetical protein
VLFYVTIVLLFETTVLCYVSIGLCYVTIVLCYVTIVPPQIKDLAGKLNMSREDVILWMKLRTADPSMAEEVTKKGKTLRVSGTGFRFIPHARFSW